MSEYLRRTKTFHVSPLLDIPVDFGAETEMGRITCVVYRGTARARREWRMACERLGITANPVVGTRDGKQGRFCRVSAYSCSGLAEALAELTKIEIWFPSEIQGEQGKYACLVMSWNQCESRPPRGLTQMGPKKLPIRAKKKSAKDNTGNGRRTHDIMEALAAIEEVGSPDCFDADCYVI